MNKKIKIKLIAPAESNQHLLNWRDPLGIRKNKGWAIPLALPTLAALTPADTEVSIIDENVEIDYQEPADLVGISFMTPLAKRAYQIADNYRKNGSTVVLGGVHVSMLPEEGLSHADAIVVGEAEESWPDLINDYRSKKLRKIYESSKQTDLSNLLVPRWDLCKINHYNFHMLQFSRGCLFDCDFCSVKAFFGKGVRYKPIENVLKELEALKKIDDKKVIFFADDNIICDICYIKKLLQVILPMKIRWFCQASINLANHSELLNLMYKSGCRQVFIGFESLSQESLNLMNKGAVNKVDAFISSVEKIQSYGISVFSSFVLGNDSDDKDIFEKTATFIEKSNIAFSLINVITPLPGTRLYRKLYESHRLISDNWENYNGKTVCFKPSKMTADELQEGYVSVLKKIYSYKKVYIRLHKLWQKGLLLRKKNYFLDLLNQEKVYLFIASLFDKNVERKRFLLKSVFNKKNPALSPILMALSFHDFAFNNAEFKENNV